MFIVRLIKFRKNTDFPQDKKGCQEKTISVYVYFKHPRQPEGTKEA